MAGGNRGHDEVDSALYIQGQKHRITARIRRCLEWHQAIEPINGHLKIFVRPGRNRLKRIEGDNMNVLIRCTGHKLQLILKCLAGQLCLNIFSFSNSVGMLPETGAVRATKYGFGALYVV